jgi:phosphoribosylanthranilate isomerase
MRAEDIAHNGLFVKICGVTTEEDALLAVALGADALGFNFVAGSTRRVTPAAVADIVKRLPPDVATFGVFRNEAPERVVEIVLRAGLTGAQLHGHETALQCRFVAERVRFTIQAFGAGDPALDRARDYPVDVILLDNPTPGSGQVFDWSMIEGLPDGKRLLLAGGLNPDNVANAVKAVEPWGVDVATGVESGPGRKDAVKLRQFIANARTADEQVSKRQAERRGPKSVDAPYDWQEEL